LIEVNLNFEHYVPHGSPPKHILTNSSNLILLFTAFVLGAGFITRVEIRKFATGVFPYATFFIFYMLIFYGAVPLGIDLWRLPNDVLIVDHPFPSTIPITTILFVLAYAIVHLLSYFTSLKYIEATVERHDDGGKRDDNSVRLIIALFVTTISVSLLIAGTRGNELPGSAQLVESLWRCGFVILAWLAISRQISIPWITVFAFITLLKSYVILRDGLLTSTLIDITIIIALLLYLRKFISIPLFIGLFLVVLLSYQNIKCIHRSTESVVLKTDGSLNLCFGNQLKDSVKSIARRSSHLHVLQQVIDRTPETTENRALSPILRAITNHIPRLIWDKKPEENRGGIFGKEYGILAPTDNKTSWNIPWLTDFFIHGRFSAALIYAMVSGIFLGAGVGWMSKLRDKQLGFGLYAASLFPLFYQSSNFSLMTGSIGWVILVILTIYASISFIMRKIRS
jgi:hypothetical protein